MRSRADCFAAIVTPTKRKPVRNFIGREKTRTAWYRNAMIHRSNLNHSMHSANSAAIVRQRSQSSGSPSPHCWQTFEIHASIDPGLVFVGPSQSATGLARLKARVAKKKTRVRVRRIRAKRPSAERGRNQTHSAWFPSSLPVFSGQLPPLR